MEKYSYIREDELIQVKKESKTTPIVLEGQQVQVC